MYKYRPEKRVNGVKYKVHRLIMEQYLGRHLLTSELVHHVDGDTTNNIIENLEIVTRAKHREIHCIVGRGYKGSQHGRAKLIESDVISIRQLIKEGRTLKTIAILFNVSPQTISNIKLYKNWTHI